MFTALLVELKKIVLSCSRHIQEVPHPPAAVRRRGGLALRAAGHGYSPHPHRGEAATGGPAGRHSWDAASAQRALQNPGRRLCPQKSRGVKEWETRGRGGREGEKGGRPRGGKETTGGQAEREGGGGDERVGGMKGKEIWRVFVSRFFFVRAAPHPLLTPPRPLPLLHPLMPTSPVAFSFSPLPHLFYILLHFGNRSSKWRKIPFPA